MVICGQLSRAGSPCSCEGVARPVQDPTSVLSRKLVEKWLTENTEQYMNTNQTATFDDSVAESSTPEYGTKPVQAAEVPVALTSFFERPVEIARGSWGTAADIGLSYGHFDPWQRFITNPAVKAKLDNYQLFRGTLHLRITLNGSPFHYGLLAFNYFPYATTMYHGYITGPALGFQAPGVILDPAAETVAEMTVPFFSMADWIDLSPTGHTGTVTADGNCELGRLLIQVISPLRFANTGTAETVDYTIFAWMTDVELAVPTPYPVLITEQAKGKKAKSGSVVYRKTRGSEQDKASGIISQVSSSVAQVAGRLKDIPVLGPFATATEIGASAVSQIASIFGFSRPTNIEGPSKNKVVLYSSTALAIGGDTSEPMSLDPRNEIPLGPSRFGLPEVDELALDYVLSRPSYAHACSWTDTAASGDALMRIPVTPGLAHTIDDFIYTTPLFYFSRAFLYWTGSIKYKISVVCSKFHRGRVRVAYVPRDAAILPNVDYTNTTFNTIIDISTDKEVEIEIPWSQSLPWLPTKQVGINDTSTYEFVNGTLVFQVVNELRGPVSPTDVSLIVTATAGDDFKFAKPYVTGLQPYILPYDTPNFGGVNEHFVSMPPKNMLSTDDAKLGSGNYSALNQGAGYSESEMMNFGESIVSIRPLLKRYCKFAGDGNRRPNAIGDLQNPKALVIQVPYTPADAWPGTASAGLSTQKFERTYATFFSWFSACYAGYTGGHRWKFLFSGSPTLSGTDPLPEPPDKCLAAALVDGPGGGWFVADGRDAIWQYGSGSAISSIPVQSGIEVQVPYYFPANFLRPCVIGQTLLGLGDWSRRATLSNNSLQVRYDLPALDGAASDANSRVRFDVLHAGADDIQFYWFVCTPPVAVPASGNRQAPPAGPAREFHAGRHGDPSGAS